MDAIALDKPIICSDNLYFSDDVLKFELGAVYKAWDEDSMIAAMRKITEDEVFLAEMHK